MTERAVRVMGAALAALVAGSGSLAAQGGPRPLSLAEALRAAESQSESVTMAEAGVLRARGQQLQARSAYYPQLNLTTAYTRTLASEFQAAAGGSGQDTTAQAESCAKFTANAGLPLQARVDSLEKALACTTGQSPLSSLSGLFRNLPFGRENVYNLGLSFSQNVFTGGRVQAQNRIAASGRSVAEVALEQARAQLALDVTQAYYDAALSQRLLGIAEATVRQAETTLSQAQLARQVGNQPEFEVLRAQVTRDNLRPVLIQRRSERDLAVLRLRQLLNLPAGEQLDLTTGLGDEELARTVPAVTQAARVTAAPPATDTSAVTRSAVRQAEEAVRVQESQLRISRAQRLPSLVLSSSYGRVAYPTSPVPDFSNSRANWTVTVGMQVPLFTGGRLQGEQLVARAGVLEARARLQQVRELALLDTRSAQEQLAAAQASWQASQGTVEQAGRAYQIAEVRYREGISTQVELSDSRILLQQAEANRAVAARNLQVARARLALLPNLPLGSGSAAAGAAQAQQPQQSQQQAPAQAQPQSGARAGQGTSSTFTTIPGGQ